MDVLPTKKGRSQKQSSLTPAKEFESLRPSSRAISTTICSPGPKKKPCQSTAFIDSHHGNYTPAKRVAGRAAKDNNRNFSDVAFEKHI